MNRRIVFVVCDVFGLTWMRTPLQPAQQAPDSFQDEGNNFQGVRARKSRKGEEASLLLACSPRALYNDEPKTNRRLPRGQTPLRITYRCLKLNCQNGDLFVNCFNFRSQTSPEHARRYEKRNAIGKTQTSEYLKNTGFLLKSIISCPGFSCRFQAKNIVVSSLRLQITVLSISVK